MDDLISRQAAISAICNACGKIDCDQMDTCEKVFTAQPEKRTEERTETHACDLVNRKAAITAIQKAYADTEGGEDKCAVWNNVGLTNALHIMQDLPSAQPERTCVNCGRTANNGGWYADGGTRCPIEEHYALPKDGYCHLWEKRNVTDDDYPERRTDE